MKVNGTKCLLIAALFSVIGINAIAAPVAGDDDEKVSFEVGADVVSSYIWRGTDCGGFSIQPSATVTWNRPGISLGVWASATLFETSQFANMSEFDLVLSYAPTSALSFTLTDYHFCDGRYWADWNFSGKASHFLEATVALDFGAVAFEWDTALTGNDYRASGKRAYSTYVQASAPFSLAGVDCSATVGACPWGYGFGDLKTGGFMVTNIALKAEKTIKSLPLFGQVVFNPNTEATYFVVGISF